MNGVDGLFQHDMHDVFNDIMNDVYDDIYDDEPHDIWNDMSYMRVYVIGYAMHVRH